MGHIGEHVTLDEPAFIHESAWLYGKVHVGPGVSIWTNAVTRAETYEIRIGARTNIQDGTVLHVTHDGPFNPAGFPLHIGEDVTVGHRALLHGCTVGNRVLVGMGAIIMDAVVVEDDVMIAAGALVTPGKKLRSGYLYAGSPAREVRALTEDEIRFLPYSASGYTSLKQRYLDSSA